MSALKYWDDVAGEWKYVTVPLVGTPISYVTATGGATSIPSNNSNTYMSGWTTIVGETSWVNATTGEITVPEDGWYLIDGGFRYDSGTPSGSRLITYIVVNGSLLLGSRNEIDSGNSSTPSLNPSGQTYLAAGDKIAILVYQASGSTWNISLQGISVTRIPEAPVILDNRYAKTPGPWVTPTLLNGWTQYGSSFRPARYRIVGDEVQIEGLVKGSSASSDTIFNLPADYTPSLGGIFSCSGPVVGSGGANNSYRVDVSDGSVSAISAVNPTATPTYLSLANIRYARD